MWDLFGRLALSTFKRFQRLNRGDTKVLICRDGTLFRKAPGPFRVITEVPEYWTEDIRKTDAVLDIGANAGAFCIRAARSCSHVVAVEPVTGDLLSENIHLNGVHVPVIKAALGDGRPAEITWDGCTASVPTYTLRQLIDLAGGCDFLKCDCEGAEWLIDPADLSGIRRIEMELHQPPIGGTPNPQFLEAVAASYGFEIERTPCHGPMGKMGILHAWRQGNDSSPG